jgi:hypothetical protein
MSALKPKYTAVLYLNEQLLLLEGTVSLPLGARIEIDRQDYIVNNVRLRAMGEEFDVYYDVHLAEETGKQASPLD